MNTAVEQAADSSAPPDLESDESRPAARNWPSSPAQSNLRLHLIKGTRRLVGLLAVDSVVIGLAWAFLRAARAGVLGEGLGGLANGLLPAGSISAVQLGLAIIVTFYLAGAYRDGDRWQDPVKILSASAIGVAISLYSDLWHGEPFAAVGRGLLVWLCLGPLLVAGRSTAKAIAKRSVAGGMTHRVVEVIGEGANGPLDLGPSYPFVSSFRHETLSADMGRMERLLSGGIDTIVVRGELLPDRFRMLVDFALTHGCRLLCAPYPAQLPGVAKIRVWVEGHPLLELTAPGLRASHLVLKRAFDLVVATAALGLASPLLAILALAIKLDSPGRILFSQSRPGIRGRVFRIYKFRSMRIDAEEQLDMDARLYERFLQNGCKLPDGEDPRVTRVGRFLRRTSLDELPQLLNVIRGDMSLVGPRPLVGPELENYGERVSTLLSVKPGMTGLWQVSGRSAIPFPERAEMDLEYVRTWSFLGDLWILLLTPSAVLFRRGAH